MSTFSDRFSVKLTVPYVTLILGLFLTATTALFYLMTNKGSVPLDNLLKLIAAGVGITAALYAALNLARLNCAHQETIDLKKKELTAKFIERWLDPKLTEALREIGDFVKDAPSLTPSEIATKFDTDSALRHNALLVLNVLEALAVELKYEALHPEMAKAYFRGIAVTYYSKLSGVVSLRRTRADNPRVYTDLEELIKAWAK